MMIKSDYDDNVIINPMIVTTSDIAPEVDRLMRKNRSSDDPSII
jgi:hypothetical protein